MAVKTAGLVHSVNINVVMPCEVVPNANLSMMLMNQFAYNALMPGS